MHLNQIEYNINTISEEKTRITSKTIFLLYKDCRCNLNDFEEFIKKKLNKYNLKWYVVGKEDTKGQNQNYNFYFMCNVGKNLSINLSYLNFEQENQIIVPTVKNAKDKVFYFTLIKNTGDYLEHNINIKEKLNDKDVSSFNKSLDGDNDDETDAKKTNRKSKDKEKDSKGNIDINKSISGLDKNDKEQDIQKPRKYKRLANEGAKLSNDAVKIMFKDKVNKYFDIEDIGNSKKMKISKAAGLKDFSSADQDSDIIEKVEKDKTEKSLKQSNGKNNNQNSLDSNDNKMKKSVKEIKKTMRLKNAVKSLGNITFDTKPKKKLEVIKAAKNGSSNANLFAFPLGRKRKRSMQEAYMPQKRKYVRRKKLENPPILAYKKRKHKKKNYNEESNSSVHSKRRYKRASKDSQESSSKTDKEILKSLDMKINSFDIFDKLYTDQDYSSVFKKGSRTNDNTNQKSSLFTSIGGKNRKAIYENNRYLRNVRLLLEDFEDGRISARKFVEMKKGIEEYNDLRLRIQECEKEDYAKKSEKDQKDKTDSNVSNTGNTHNLTDGKIGDMDVSECASASEIDISIG